MSLGLPADSPRLREAYDLMRYLLEPRRQQAYARTIRALPPTREGVEEILKGSEPLRESVLESLGRARALANNSLTGTLEKVFGRVAESLSRHVMRGTYKREILRQELVRAAAEMDYVFQLSS